MRQPEARSVRSRTPIVQSIFSESASQPHPRRRSAMPPHLQRPEFKELAGILAFAGQFVAEFRSTASVMPSSPQLAHAMVNPAAKLDANVVVEFGPGTGPMTDRILRSLPSDGKLFSFEINPTFVEYLETHFPDPRLRVVPLGAEEAADTIREHGFPFADAVISSLPLSFFQPEMRDRILQTAARALRPGGVFTQFQYASGLDCSGRFPKPYDLRPLLGRHFGQVDRRLVWLNFPPAFCYTCVAE